MTPSRELTDNMVSAKLRVLQAWPVFSSAMKRGENVRRWMIALAVLTVAFGINSKDARAQTGLALFSNGTFVTQFTAGDGPNVLVGAVDQGWLVTIEAGTSNSPNLTPDGIDIASLDVSCVTATCRTHPLQVLFSGLGFTQSVSTGHFNTAYTASLVTGTLGHTPSTSQSAYSDNLNAIFGKATPIGTVGPFSAIGSGSASGGGPAGPAAYSLTIDDTFNAGGGNATFSALGNITATPTPEPGSMLLFGTGLLGLGGILRRRLRLA